MRNIIYGIFFFGCVMATQYMASGEIHDAVLNGDTKRVKESIQKDPDCINLRHDEIAFGPTLLYTAVVNGYYHIVRELFQFPHLDPNMDNILHVAISGRDTPMLCLLLSLSNVDINLQDPSSLTPLHVAVDSGNCDAVKELLRHEGIDINMADDDNGKTPLSMALHHVHEKSDIAHTLLYDLRIDPNAGFPLHILAQQDEHDHFLDRAPQHVTNHMIRHRDTDINKQDPETGATPLHIAVAQANLTLTHALLQHPDIDSTLRDNEDNASPLDIAAERANNDVLHVLIAHMPPHDISRLRETWEDFDTTLYHIANNCEYAEIADFIRQFIDPLQVSYET